jgi:hypothetical protein
MMNLHAEGLLPTKVFIKWKVLINHQILALEMGEIVLFKSIIEQGLGLPASDSL